MVLVSSFSKLIFDNVLFVLKKFVYKESPAFCATPITSSQDMPNDSGVSSCHAAREIEYY